MCLFSILVHLTRSNQENVKTQKWNKTFYQLVACGLMCHHYLSLSGLFWARVFWAFFKKYFYLTPLEPAGRLVSVRLDVFLAILNQSRCDQLPVQGLHQNWHVVCLCFFFWGNGRISQDYVSTLAGNEHRWQHCWGHSCFYVVQGTRQRRSRPWTRTGSFLSLVSSYLPYL